MTYTIRLLPERRSCSSDEPLELAAVAASCDVLLEQPCGSKRSCGKCRVRVVDGDVPATEDDRRVLEPDLVAAGWRLGCALVVGASATIEVPRAARAVPAKSFGAEDLFAGTTIVAAETDAVRGAKERGVAPLGIAIDVGSTTLAAALVRLDTGAVLATASALNPQVRVGADVVSRIRYAQEHPDGNMRLHEALARALDQLVATCAAAAAVPASAIGAVTCVGNPTMMHTLLARDVTGLGHAPFEGVLVGPWRGDASALGLASLRTAPAYVVPGIRSHVGGDAVAAILATGLDRATGITLLIDLGTNTEVVLGSRDGIVCTSASAGPAFEGATIQQGMRAAPGAIEQVRVRVDGSIIVRTIGNAPAIGICGSGLVDAVAELVQAGVIELSGRMRAPEEVSLPGMHEHLVELPGGGRAVRLTTDVVPPVHLTAIDVRQLQLVKGSIAASTQMLLARLGATPDDLGEVLIAGAFGGWVRKTSAQAIGLVPPIDPERIRFVGDAAAVGARLALVDRIARDRAEAIAANAQYVELAGRHEYAEAFVDSLEFAFTEEGVR